MKRVWTLLFAGFVAIALNALGILLFNFEPLTKAELLLLTFVSAWAGDVKQGR